MKLVRFLNRAREVRVGLLLSDGNVAHLDSCGISTLSEILEREDPAGFLCGLSTASLPQTAAGEVSLLAPVESQEVWAAGVTYERSKTARMEESDFSANAYDRVYEAARPELFFKSLPDKVSGTGQPVGIRRDSRWNVPEPELALVLNSRGTIVGYTAGNDMSSRDIEGENLLYLPQAKIYRHSCALGPCVRVGVGEPEARGWKITLTIRRQGHPVFQGHTSVGNIRRRFQDLAAHLFRSQDFPRGVVLLTGTGIVPSGDFTLRPGDVVTVAIEGIGELANPVIEV